MTCYLPTDDDKSTIHIPVPCHFSNQKSAGSEWIPHTQTGLHVNYGHTQKVLFLRGPHQRRLDGIWSVCAALMLVRRMNAVRVCLAASLSPHGTNLYLMSFQIEGGGNAKSLHHSEAHWQQHGINS